MVRTDSEQDPPCSDSSCSARFHLGFDQIDACRCTLQKVEARRLTTSQWLIWPSVENMNSNPEWLMPPMGKQDVSPYDILIDLVPWYVLTLGSSESVRLLLSGHK